MILLNNGNVDIEMGEYIATFHSKLGFAVRHTAMFDTGPAKKLYPPRDAHTFNTPEKNNIWQCLAPLTSPIKQYSKPNAYPDVGGGGAARYKEESVPHGRERLYTIEGLRAGQGPRIKCHALLASGLDGYIDGRIDGRA